MADGSRAQLAGAAAGVVVTGALALWLSSWTGAGGTSAGAALVWTILASAPYAILWVASAQGLGGWLRRRLLPGAEDGVALAAALGVAALLVADGLLARVGALTIAGGAGAWITLLPGLVLFALDVRRAVRRSSTIAMPPGLVWTAAPALAVLLVAVGSAPGWLWASEFGGYDALSYHLQLPKEWHAGGRLEGLEHNVYGHLPSAVEAAYLHVFALARNGARAAYSAQMLHAMLGLVAAAVAGALGRRLGGRRAGAAVFVLVLGTPWVVVAGSLAYDEMAVLLLVAGVLLVLDDTGAAPPTLGRAVALGLLVGAACAAKLTAVGFVALPAVILLAAGARRAQAGWRHVTASLAVMAVTVLLTLGPWLVANTVQTRNPVFPFATTMLGPGHWTGDQAATWARAHFADLTVGERLVEGWRQLLRHGIGPPPDPSEPWAPQWSVLPWLALAAAVLTLAGPPPRRRAVAMLVVLLTQTVFWLAATHVKSRFMLPAAVPAAVLVVAGACVIETRIEARRARRAAFGLGAVALAAHAAVALLVFAREQDGRPAAAVGAIPELTGEADAWRLEHGTLTDDERHALLATASPPFWINHALPDGARTLFVGEATPFYYDLEAIAYQTTWDRGPLSDAMRAAPDDPAAWIGRLREAGFTHLLVNDVMLTRWADDGWNDPLITPERVTGAAERHATLERRWPWGLSLYRLGRTP